jgi:hypothetical protein
MSALGLALAGPVALVALPLAALLLAVRGRRPAATAIALLAGLLGLVWLLATGDLPEQAVRAAALLATVTYVLCSLRTDWTVTHRALLAIGVAVAGVALAFVAFGWSWHRLTWWVAFRTSPALRLLLAGMTVSTPDGVGVDLDRPDFDATLDDLVRISAELFPATIALQIFAGLLLATVLVPRLAGATVGRPPGRLIEFRFSEHLGWLLALGILVVLLPGLGPARPLGLNLLVVMGALYGIRGAAVILAGIRAVRGGPLLYLAAALAVFFLLPGVVLLGVLDAGLNLRRPRRPPGEA